MKWSTEENERFCHLRKQVINETLALSTEDTLVDIECFGRMGLSDQFSVVY